MYFVDFHKTLHMMILSIKKKNSLSTKSCQVTCGGM